MTVSFAGFQTFVTGVMGVASGNLPATGQQQFCYDLALYTVNQWLQNVAPGAPPQIVQSLYDVAVYNLAGHNLALLATDQSSQTNPTFWTSLRITLGLNAFAAGTVISAADESTSASFTAAEWASTLTVGQLQYLKTPWGRQYIDFAQKIGTVWGVS